jgi:hypothetical protein
MKKTHLIGLSGPAGCGKDTVADLLVTHCGFTKVAFADALRAEICNAWRIDPLDLTRRDTKETPVKRLALMHCTDYGFVGRMIVLQQRSGIEVDLEAPLSPRQVLQRWGTEYRRADDPRYWVSALSLRISYLLNQRLATGIVITDCRFANEADMARHAHGGLLWQVKRPGIEVAATAHISEVSGAAFEPDLIINNCHTIAHLQALTIGAWVMSETRLDADDIVRMGRAHEADNHDWGQFLDQPLALASL